MNIFEFRRLKQIIELNEQEIAEHEQLLRNIDYHMKRHFKGFDKETLVEHLENNIQELHFNTQHCLSQIMNFDYTIEEFEYLDSIGHFNEEMEE